MFPKRRAGRPKVFGIISPNFFGAIKGGGEIQTRFLAQELLRRGWVVHFIREGCSQEGRTQVLDGIIIHSLPRRLAFMTWLNIVPLFRCMRRVEASAWYCRAMRTYLFSVWLAARRLGGKVLWACSSDIYVTKDLGLKSSGGNLLLRGIQELDKRLFLKALRNIDFVVLQTQSQKRQLLQNWNIRGIVVRNGYPGLPSAGGPRVPSLLWIGSLKKKKRPEKFLFLVKSLAGKDYRFSMIGKFLEDPETLRSVREAEARYPDFRYLGEKEPGEIHALLGQARLLVHTGDYEGFPNVFIEAWLMGVPVVSLNVDPDGFIQSQRLGRLSGSMDQLVKDIQELMSDEPLWNECSRNAARFAREMFDIQQNTDTLLRLTGLDGS